MYRRESLVSLLRKHDVIEIGLKQKGTFCMLFNQLCIQCLLSMVTLAHSLPDPRVGERA